MAKKLKIKKEKNNSKSPGKFKRNLKTLIVILFYTLGIVVASTFLIFGLYIIITAPDFNAQKLYKSESSVFYDTDGNEIARLGAENRVLVTYDDLPQNMIDALVATEDSRFFQHNGFDAARFFKASLGQAMGNSNAGGASTLTMQLVKNNYTSSEASGMKGIIRKFTDIYMAVFKIEKTYTKEEIIEFYVNSQWFGNGNINYSGIYGVEQASQEFFGKSVNDLSLSESALIVGMFNNPTAFNPYNFPNAATKRRETVLNLMVKHGYLTKEECDAANSIPIQTLLVSRDDKSFTNPYQQFIDYTVKNIIEVTGNDPRHVPMSVKTTMNRNVQDVVNNVTNGTGGYTFADDKVQMGMAITSTKDGSVVALSGGRNYQAMGLNRATDISRQPGSTAKPIFDYGPYIEYNNGSPSTYFFDMPYTYSSGGSIKNYDNRYKGMMTMRDALVDSRNIPALQAFQAVDKEKIADFVHKLGIHYGEGLPYESCSIGGFDGVSPLEASAAYAAFGRGGSYIAPYAFTEITYLDTDKTEKYTPEKVKVMSEETAYLITDMLVTGGKQGVGGSIHVSGTEVAAKGGTTTMDASSRKTYGYPSSVTPDHWNNTYTPDYSISLWYGYDKNEKGVYLTSTPGGKARRGIMAAVANKIYKKDSTFKKPSGIVTVTVEKDSIPFTLASETTPESMRMSAMFKKGTEPTEESTRFGRLNDPSNGTYTTTGNTINLSWSPAKASEGTSEAAIADYYNENYGKFAEKFYQARLDYNNANIGSVGYEIYVNGNYVGYTDSTSYTYTGDGVSNYDFTIKTAYSIFKDNRSNGISISTKYPTSVITPSTDDTNTNTNTNTDTNSENTSSTIIPNEYVLE